jgi:hypothetical protein
MMDITEDNFLIFAMKSYNSPNCIMAEFESDLKRIKYIKRLIRKYRTSGEIKERLLLNHIIVLANVFGVEASVRILFFKLPESDYPILKPFLLFVNYLPRVVLGINGKNIVTSDIHIDLDISRRLMDIYRKS